MNENKEENYTPETLLRYHAAVAVAEKLEAEGFLSPADRRKILTALNRKYGFDSGSIFAA